MQTQSLSSEQKKQEDIRKDSKEGIFQGYKTTDKQQNI